MKTRFFLIILSLLILLPWTACSNGRDPSIPSDLTPDVGLEAPEITPPRDSSDGPDAPDAAEVDIELDPSGEPTCGQFTFAGTPVAGLEVRINGELADVTDDEGNFEIPSIRNGAHTISFGMFGEVFHSQPYSPVSRFAQDSPEPGPGVMTGEVTDEDGPVAGALIIVLKGDNYSFAFTGQYGQYQLTGAPEGNSLAACVAEFHEPVFAAVNIPGNGTPLEKDFYAEKNLSLGRVYGRVVSPGLGAVPFAYIQYEAPGVFRADLSNIFGIFELEAIPIGNGILSAVREYFYPVQFPLEINPGINPVPVIMHVIEQSTVHGYVVDPQGEPLDGALVRLQIHQDDNKYPAVYGALSGPQGYFHFEDLLPGAYALQAFMPGRIPATELGVILPGKLIEETLVLYPGTGGHAHGWAVDWEGEPIKTAIVQLKYIGSDVNILAVTADNGYWELNDVPYGACEVVVHSAAFLPGRSWCDIYPNDPGETITMCVPPLNVPVGEMTGSVYNSNGETVPYALVWIYNLGNPEVASHMTLADELGEYYFPNAIAGTTAGWALADGYLPDDGYIEIVEGEIVELDFELIPE